MADNETVYVIRDWQENFENNRTRDVKRMVWVPIPTKLDGDGYTELLDHDDGPAHYAAWIACVIVAAKCHPRGTLLRDGRKPHTESSLARISRIPKNVFENAIPRLIEIGWMDCKPLSEITLATISHNGASSTHFGAPSRAGATPTPTPTPTPITTGQDTGNRSARASMKGGSGSGVFQMLSRETVEDAQKLLDWSVRGLADPNCRLPDTDLGRISLLATADRICHDGRVKNPAACLVRRLKTGEMDEPTADREERARRAVDEWKRSRRSNGGHPAVDQVNQSFEDRGQA